MELLSVYNVKILAILRKLESFVMNSTNEKISILENRIASLENVQVDPPSPLRKKVK